MMMMMMVMMMVVVVVVMMMSMEWLGALYYYICTPAGCFPTCSMGWGTGGFFASQWRSWVPYTTTFAHLHDDDDDNDDGDDDDDDVVSVVGDGDDDGGEGDDYADADET